MIDISNFDPNAAGNPQLNIFGLPYTEDQSRLIIQPVPWEATVNWNGGTARSIEHVMKASLQIDLNHKDAPNGWRAGIYMKGINKKILSKSDYLRKESELLVDYTCRGEKIDGNDFMCKNLQDINEGGIFLNHWVYDHTSELLKAGKMVGLLGGDQSIAQGFVKALSEQYKEFGILQIDAHCDLRKSYQGFKYSHATVMYNILEETTAVKKLVQVGVRNYCLEEAQYIEAHRDRVLTFRDQSYRERMYEGLSWQQIVDEIIEALPDLIYISFDIDGLDPSNCPNTSTPVPGGLTYQQAVYLLKRVVSRGKKIIGFDLSEVSAGDNNIDATIGAYVLWQLCNWMLISENNNIF